ncbi:MAG: tyrosine recombinase XerC [Clostridia bacterium]|nr:tyrosine recombinase XerC [Clostridia bacterium]
MRQEEISTLPPLVISYLNYLEGTMNKSPLTVLEYGSDLRTFFRFMKIRRNLVDKNTEFENIDISDVDKDFICSVTLEDAYSFLAYCRSSRGNDSNARARKSISIKRFYRYLEIQSILTGKNMMAFLDSPKTKKGLPKYLSLDQAVNLLNSVEGKNKERDFCILTLFLNCGLRLSELVNINFSDLSFDNRTLRVLGKGNKERIIYLNNSCISALKEYIAKRPKDGVIDRDALFLSNRRTRISRESVQKMAEKYFTKIGIDNMGFSVHKLRHTAATLMYQYGNTDVLQIKSLLGHENLATTEIYTHISNEQLKKAVDSNPLNKLNIDFDDEDDDEE